MEINQSDTYRVLFRGGLAESSIKSLTQLYQPLVGGDAILIYLTLSSKAGVYQKDLSMTDLFHVLNDIPVMTFEKAVARLEEYMLVRTYVRRSEEHSIFQFVLHTPLSGTDFFTTGVFASRYMKIVGKKKFDETASQFLSRDPLLGFEDITHPVTNLKETDFKNEIEYSTIKPRYVFENDDQAVHFDYEHFFQTTSTLVFPSELRTQENLAMIGKLATLYGINADHMRILVSRCTNIDSLEFDAEKLKLLASRQKPDYMKSNDPYDVSPVSFLQSKQNGAEVTLQDKRLLERLSMDMHFSNAVINVMIEHILNISQNRLNYKFVDMVAGEWARDGVVTKEQALKETKKVIQTQTSSQRTSRVKLPAYYSEQKEVKAEEKDESLLARAREMQEKMRGGQ